MAVPSVGDLDVGRETVAAVAHRGDDRGPERIGLDLTAQTADLVVDGAVERPCGAAGCEVEQFLAAQHHPRALEEHAKQFEIGRGKARLAAVGADQCAAVGVESEVSDASS